MNANAVTSAVRLEIRQRTGIIWIDNPPVNAASHAVRKGIVDALARLTEEGADAAILIGSGTTFIAGSDIKEFGAPLADPQMPDVIAAIEAFPGPVVAALHGVCLGGGYELALGCDARIGAPGTKVGLPEVSLGMIPGAGGTQRLPRLIGMTRSVEVITTSRRVESQEALALGMIDAVAEGPLLEAAIEYAASLGDRKRRLRDRPVLDLGDVGDFKAAVAAALSRARGQSSVAEAIAAIEMAATLGIEEGLARERAAFQRLRIAPEATALRYQFFAQRQAARLPEGVEATPRTMDAVGVVGGGTMGAGIAFAFLKADHGVTLLERDEVALEQGRSKISGLIDRDVRAGRMSPDDAAKAAGRLTGTTRHEALGASDLVIEAVFEDMDLKKELFSRLDSLLKPGAILASNTSYLDLDEMASATGRARDVVGLHFFAPAHVMKLLEIVRGRETANEVLATALAVAKRLGKTPIVAGVGEGFVGNRIYAAYRQQCEFLVEEGALPDQVDKALESFGFALGPFAVSDMSGLDIAWQRRKRLAGTRDPQARYCDIADRLCEMGRFGQKAGAGWYRYEPGSRRGIPDPLVEALIEEGAKASGIVRASIGDEEIVARAMAAIVNEGAAVLADGSARRASDIDVAMVAGYGFPAHKGGPIYWAAQQSRDELEAALDRMTAKSPGVLRVDVGSALAQIAGGGKSG